MTTNLGKLEQRREAILEKISAMGEFRRGTISKGYVRCNKPSCHCAKEGDRGHGPRYLWSATIGGKSYAKHLKTPAEVEQYRQQTARYRAFVELCDALVKVNEELCQLRSTMEVSTGAEDVKKKLWRRLRKS